MSIEDELCQTINGTKYGFIGLQFEKPEGAVKVSYTIAGGAATEVDLKGADAENLFKGNLILYFAFAQADKTTLAAGSWKVELTWKNEADETIVTRSATIKRAAADGDGDGGDQGGSGDGGDQGGSGDGGNTENPGTGGTGGDNSEGGQPENPGTGPEGAGNPTEE